MSTLRDYVRSYGYIPILRIVGDKEYYVVKPETSNVYYFMHTDEVIDQIHSLQDKTEELILKIINKKATEDDMKLLDKQEVYKQFKKFYKEQAGKDWMFDPLEISSSGNNIEP